MNYVIHFHAPLSDGCAGHRQRCQRTSAGPAGRYSEGTRLARSLIRDLVQRAGSIPTSHAVGGRRGQGLAAGHWELLRKQWDGRQCAGAALPRVQAAQLARVPARVAAIFRWRGLVLSASMSTISGARSEFGISGNYEATSIAQGQVEVLTIKQISAVGALLLTATRI
jgi:hypothetical protein